MINGPGGGDMADLEKITRKKLGEILVAEGIVSQEQVNEALRVQETTGERLGEVLVKAGYTTETEIAKTLCTQFAKPFIKASKYDVTKEVLTLLPPRLMVEHDFVPIDRFGNLLVVAMAGLLDAATLAEIQKTTGCDVEVYIATASDVRQTLRKQFPDAYDPITLQPRHDATQFLTQAFVSPAAAPPRGNGGSAPDMGQTTRDLVGVAEEESDWEALFEEAEQNVLRELKEKKVPPPPTER
jgi:hypothetical protein